jgi:DNA-binding NarL/FixJ family response regulator
MSVQTAEHLSATLDIDARQARATSDSSIAALGVPGLTWPEPTRSADPDESAAYALLAEQCRSRVDSLAPRQRDVLAGLVAGYSNKKIAHLLGISPRTIEIYRAGMMHRLKVRTLAQALHIAFVAGLAPSDTISLGTG